MIVIGLVLLCLICLFTIRRDELMQNPHFRDKVPGAQKFIKAHAKKYDPNDPKMKEGCVICMEDFSETD